MSLSLLVLSVVVLALYATPVSARDGIRGPRVEGHGVRPEVEACRGEAQCVETVLRLEPSVTIEEALALADALDELHHAPRLALHLRIEARPPGVSRHAATCAEARRREAAPETSAAQRAMFRQYIAAQCP